VPNVPVYTPIPRDPKPLPSKSQRRKQAKRRKQASTVNRNVLSDANLTLGGAIERYRVTGKPVPAHLAHRVRFVSGTDTAKGDGPLPQKLQIGRPWYRMGDQAHTGNNNPAHGTSFPIPGRNL
jgi:hypothetical protein